MNSKLWAAVAAISGFAVQAQATVIDFNQYTVSFADAVSFASQGFTFTPNGTLIGVWTSAPRPAADSPLTNVWNGTSYLLAGYGNGFSIAATNGSAFVLQSYDIALGWYQTTSPRLVTATYDLVGGGTLSTVLSLSTTAFLTPTPQLAITRATFSNPIADGTFLSGYISLDNLNVTAVPEPATAAMMVFGALAVGAVVWRRRA